MEEALKLALENGLWAVMAVVLIKYILDTSKTREEKLQQVISENQNIILQMVAKLEILNHLREDVDLIKGCIINRDGRCVENVRNEGQQS